MKSGIYHSFLQLLFSSAIVAGVTTLTACNEEASSPSRATAKDTTKAIELAIHTILTEDFPEAPAMKQVGALRDSLFFAAGKFSRELLPTRVDSFHLQSFPDSLICGIMKRDTSVRALPNYIRLADFENRDSGYFIKLESLNCNAGNEGGSVGVFIIKTKDNFVFKK